MKLGKFVKREIVNLLIITSVGFITALVSICSLYNSALSSEKTFLKELVAGYTRIVKAVATFDAQYSKHDHPLGAKGATISQIQQAFSRKSSFGLSGEFILAVKNADALDTFLVSSQPSYNSSLKTDNLKPLPKQNLAETSSPKTIIFHNLSSNKVVAAYQYIPSLDAFLIAQKDFDEFNQPFIKAALLAASVAIFIIILGYAVVSHINLRAKNAKSSQAITRKTYAISSKERYVYQILMMFISSILVITVSIWSLYSSFIKSNQQTLIDLAESQVSMINAVARFDQEYSYKDFPGGASAATWYQVKSAYNILESFADTSEYHIATLNQYNINHQTNSLIKKGFSQNHSIVDEYEEAMRLALFGKSGLLLLQDIQRRNVIAAYHPINELNAGFVIKINLKELQEPFVSSALVSTKISLFAILIASLLLRQLSPNHVPHVTNKPLAAIKNSKHSFEGHKIPKRLLFITFSVPLSIFMLDLTVPLGVGSSLLYILFVMIGKWFSRRSTVLKLATAATILTIVGHFLSPDGSEEWIAILNRSLSIFAIWITAIIVSAAKANENMMKRQSEQLHILSLAVEHSPVSFMITDPKGQTEYVNLKFSEDTGYDREEIIGKNPRVIGSGNTPIEVYKSLWENVNQGLEWHGEFQNKTKDGNPYWVKTSILPISDHSKEISHIVSIQEDVTEHKALQEQLKYQATHDDLTDLPNRKFAIQEMTKAIGNAHGKDAILAILFIDLDGFKEINDKFGHEDGDKVLKIVAKRICIAAGDQSFTSRFGGDEFIVLLTNITEFDDISLSAKRIILEINKPIAVNKFTTKIGASIGVSVYPKDGDDVLKLISLADNAMYKTKKREKNNMSFHNELL